MQIVYLDGLVAKGSSKVADFPGFEEGLPLVWADGSRTAYLGRLIPTGYDLTAILLDEQRAEHECAG